MSRPKLTQFQLNIPDNVLQDLQERLSRARLPDEPPLEAWSTGTSVAYMQRLIGYWRNGFDWRAQEATLNRFRQFTVPLAGIDVHFIHEHGKGPDPMPLLLSHGWPGSVVEFHKLIPMLTDPVRYGADPADAFTVVAPSLPGYTLSFRPGQKRFSVEEIAGVFAELMTDVLGYQRFGAQGGDWGAFVTSRLGYQFAQRLTGIHLNMLAVRSGRKMLETTEEKLFRAQLDEWLKEETGYQWIQGTRPTTLAFGLTDSPVGLAAWIVEKFRAWTDNSGEPDSAVSMDEMLTNITLYWVTRAIGSSFWPYYALRHGAWPIPEGAKITVPTGYVEFPHEIIRPPRSVAQRVYTNIKRWTVMPKGGHFAALEQPEALAKEIREFFRPPRRKG
jgi:pimeloyl-ACP methyl ester carboxylesterase